MKETAKKVKRLLNVLIVSANEGNTQPLLKTVQGQPVNFFVADTVERAWDLLVGIPMDVIFCDETLPDGGYQDFLRAVREERKAARFVVLLKSQPKGNISKPCDWERPMFLQARTSRAGSNRF